MCRIVSTVHNPIGRRATLVTGESRESTFLFQQLSIALQRGDVVAFGLPQHVLLRLDAVEVIPCLVQCLTLATLC